MPVEQRFTILTTTFGLGTALGNIVATIGLIPLTSYFGHYGILVIMLPVTICVFGAVNHIRKLEIKEGLYYDYTDITDTDETTPNTTNEDEALLNCEYSKLLLDKLDKEEHKQHKKINRNLIKKAIIFAKKYHGNQLRKTGEPFYSHPLAVASIVSSLKLGSNVISAAILHDIIEDTDCTLEIIEKQFNPKVAELVRLATRTLGNGKISIKALVNNVRASYNQDAMLIKCCDRLHNLMTARGLSKAKQIELVIETLENILPSVAYGVDRCNVNDKLKLEEEIFQQCERILELNFM
jgi:hypothetical protein